MFPRNEQQFLRAAQKSGTKGRFIIGKTVVFGKFLHQDIRLSRMLPGHPREGVMLHVEVQTAPPPVQIGRAGNARTLR